jgi:hypothetical protein
VEVKMIRARTAILLTTVALCACNGAGRLALSNGRGTYNAVINRTEDEQILSMIVRQRYDETYGLLAVSTVTANVRVGASLGANVGVGSDSSYAGNLVPFSAGATYEENPTISYVPMRGEQFVERMLAPISGEQALLLSRMSTREVNAMGLLVRRANGVTNPLYAPEAESADFDSIVEGFAELRRESVLDVLRSHERTYHLLFHDYSPEQANRFSKLLAEVGIAREVPVRGELRLPLRFFVGSARGDGLDLETPSALEVIEAAGLGVDVPEEHLSEGIARRAAVDERHRFLAVHSASRCPSEAMVAVEHRGFCFYLDPRDARSKQTFSMLRTLIGIRLEGSKNEPPPPVLTLPVGR